MLNSVRFFIIAFIVIGLFSMNAKIVQSNPKEESDRCDLKKINLDLSSIDNNGLTGSGYVDYEFCIPYQDRYIKEVRDISSDIRCFHGSGGRIGCGRVKDEYLCLGNTHDKKIKNILCKLSNLDYIKRIEECFWE